MLQVSACYKRLESTIESVVLIDTTIESVVLIDIVSTLLHTADNAVDQVRIPLLLLLQASLLEGF